MAEGIPQSDVWAVLSTGAGNGIGSALCKWEQSVLDDLELLLELRTF